MQFERGSALDLLADALRRADATWHEGQIREWGALRQSERTEWRSVARAAATSVYEEISVARQHVGTR